MDVRGDVTRGKHTLGLLKCGQVWGCSEEVHPSIWSPRWPTVFYFIPSAPPETPFRPSNTHFGVRQLQEYWTGTELSSRKLETWGLHTHVPALSVCSKQFLSRNTAFPQPGGMSLKPTVGASERQALPAGLRGGGGAGVGGGQGLGLERK